MQARESVLVHGASGGVGITACQTVRANGLKVWGTAGTEERQKLFCKIEPTECLVTKKLTILIKLRNLWGMFRPSWVRLHSSVCPSSRDVACVPALFLVDYMPFFPSPPPPSETVRLQGKNALPKFRKVLPLENKPLLWRRT